MDTENSEVQAQIRRDIRGASFWANFMQILNLIVPITLAGLGAIVTISQQSAQGADPGLFSDPALVALVGVAITVLTALNRALDPTARQERNRLRKRALEMLLVEAGQADEEKLYEVRQLVVRAKIDPELVIERISADWAPVRRGRTGPEADANGSRQASASAAA